MSERDQIRSILAYAIRYRAPGLKFLKHNDHSAHVAAEGVLKHLELSNVILKIGPMPKDHSAGED